MSAIEVIAEIKALPDNELNRVLSFLVADAELREDLQDSITLEAKRHESRRPLAEQNRVMIIQKWHEFFN
jgi:hypothetical protein